MLSNPGTNSSEIVDGVLSPECSEVGRRRGDPSFSNVLLIASTLDSSDSLECRASL